MPRNRILPSGNQPEEFETEEEEEEEVEGRGCVDGVNREEEAGNGESDEELSSEKSALPVRGLDYGSDGDSDKTFPSATVENAKSETKLKKRGRDIKEKSEVKKMKKEKKRNRDDVVKEDKVKMSMGSWRLWGPEDELVILNGMLDYKEETGVDPSSNFGTFHKYIDGLLNARVDKRQLSRKVRKLKEKYLTNAQKEVSGEGPMFVKDHEAEAYEHSKKIWGGEVVGRESHGAKSKLESKKEVSYGTYDSVVDMDSVLALPAPEAEVSTKEVNGSSAKEVSGVPKPKVVRKMDLEKGDIEMKASEITMPLMVDNIVFEKGLELVEKPKLDALNEKWRKYQIDAAELYVKRLDLVREQTKVILDAMKSNS